MECKVRVGKLFLLEELREISVKGEHFGWA